MSIKIANDTANGSVTLKGQNVAGDKTITMPNLDCELAPRMQLMTAQNSTSGTSIAFTGIPSWAKKIIILFDGVSTNGTSILQVQVLTASGPITTGYSGSSTLLDSAVGYSTYSAGFLESNEAEMTSFSRRGKYELINIDSNNWVETHHVSSNTAIAQVIGAGSISLTEALTGVRITTVNGTDTFDAGQINVLYEG